MITHTLRLGLLCLALVTPWAIAQPLLQLDVTHAGNRLVSVGDRGRILYSDDHGQQWLTAQTPTQPLLTAVYFPDPQQGWAVGHDAQILATQDGGEHWRLQFQDPARQAPLLGVWFADAQHGFAVGAYGALLRTEDGGEHWQAEDDILDNPEQLHLNAITALADGTLLIVGEAGTVLRSVDGGAQWQRLPAPGDGSLFGVLATAHPGTALIFGVRGHVYRSTDSGASWQPVGVPGVESGLAGANVQADGSITLVGDAGALLRSTDDGQHFTLTQRADRHALSSVTESGDGALIVAGQGGVQRIALPVTGSTAP